MNNKLRQEILSELKFLLNEAVPAGYGKSVVDASKALRAAQVGAETTPAIQQAATTAAETTSQAATKSPTTWGDVAKGLRQIGSGTTQRAKAAWDFMRSKPQTLRALGQAANAARATSPAAFGASTSVALTLSYAAAGAVIGAAIGYAINKLISTSFGDELTEILEKAKSNRQFLIQELNNYKKGGYSYDEEGAGTGEFSTSLGKYFGLSTGGREKQTPNSYNSKDAVIIAGLFQIAFEEDKKNGLISETTEMKDGEEVKIINLKKGSILLNYKNLFEKVFVVGKSVMQQKLTEYNLNNFIDTLEVAYMVSSIPASTPVEEAKKETIKIGDKVKYKLKPDLGVYTVSAIDPKNGNLSIKTTSGVDAGSGENPEDYEIVKESLRKDILKQISKLLKEAPRVPSAQAAPAPAAPAPAAPAAPAQAAPAPAAPAQAAPVYKNDPKKVINFIDSRLANLKAGDDIPQNIAIGLKKGDGNNVAVQDGFDWYDAKAMGGETVYWVVLKDSNIPDVNKGRAAEAEHSSMQRQRAKGTFDGNVVKCGDPTLVVILQQYLKYVKGYNQIAVDGKYGGETHGYLRSAIGEKTPFKAVMDNPSMTCEYILFPGGLTKKVLGAGGTFDGLKQLIQSKLPAGQKVGVIPKVVPRKNKQTSSVNSVNTDNSGDVDLGSFTKFLGVKEQDDYLRNTLKLTDASVATVMRNLIKARRNSSQPNNQLTQDQINKVVDQTKRENGPDSVQIKSLEESWSVKNKNKYTQNLLERLIKDISKGSK